MCNTSMHQRGFNNLMEPFPFSTLHFLRTRNRLILPNASDPASYYNLAKDQTTNHITNSKLDIISENYETEKTPPTSPILDIIDTTLETMPEHDIDHSSNSYLNDNETLPMEKSPADLIKLKEINENNLLLAGGNTGTLATLPNINMLPLPGAGRSATGLIHQPTQLPSFEYLTPARNLSPVEFPLMELNRVGGGAFPSFLHRRPRGEKRPIPEEQKDDKYYERRKRNNEAAKKSRDARKIREDRIAFRAAFLEQENSLLRAQVMALRDELQTMRQLMSRASLSQSSMGTRPPGLL